MSSATHSSISASAQTMPLSTTAPTDTPHTLTPINWTTEILQFAITNLLSIKRKEDLNFVTKARSLKQSHFSAVATLLGPKFGQSVTTAELHSQVSLQRQIWKAFQACCSPRVFPAAGQRYPSTGAVILDDQQSARLLKAYDCKSVSVAELTAACRNGYALKDIMIEFDKVVGDKWTGLSSRAVQQSTPSPSPHTRAPVTPQTRIRSQLPTSTATVAVIDVGREQPAPQHESGSGRPYLGSFDRSSREVNYISPPQNPPSCIVSKPRTSSDQTRARLTPPPRASPYPARLSDSTSGHRGSSLCPHRWMARQKVPFLIQQYISTHRMERNLVAAIEHDDPEYLDSFLDFCDKFANVAHQYPDSTPRWRTRDL